MTTIWWAGPIVGGIEGEKKTPPAKPDEKMAVLARFLKGELPAFVEIPGAAELLHFMLALVEFRLQLMSFRQRERARARGPGRRLLAADP